MPDEELRVARLSLIGVVLFGTMVGSMLAVRWRLSDWDPASVSAPAVATIVGVPELISTRLTGCRNLFYGREGAVYEPIEIQHEGVMAELRRRRPKNLSVRFRPRRPTLREPAL